MPMSEDNPLAVRRDRPMMRPHFNIKPMFIFSRDSRNCWSRMRTRVQTLLSFIVIHFIALVYLIKELFTLHEEFTITDEIVYENFGRWAIVTGATRGIGAEVVRKLYMAGFNVIMGCRNIPKSLEVAEAVRAEFGNHSEQIIVSIKMDLTSKDSVARFANQVWSHTKGQLHVLINNAGVMFPGCILTADGMDLQLQTNYMGHFALSSHMLPILLRSGTPERPTRIVNVSSVAHYGTVLGRKPYKIFSQYNTIQMYMDSKFMQILSSVIWNRLLTEAEIPVHILNVHPGIVNTQLYENVFYYETAKSIMRWLCKTPRQGADCIMFAALSPTLNERTPLFLMNCKEVDPHPDVKHPILQENFWYISCVGTGISENPIPGICRAAAIQENKENLPPWA